MNTTMNPTLADLQFGPPEPFTTETGTYFVSSWAPTPALAAAQAALTANGDEFDLAGGRTLRLVIEPDWDVSINDYDVYGKTEWSTDNDFGSVRPDGFTGRAVIIDRERFATLWWEPYEGQSEEDARKFEPMVTRLIEEGFCQVGLVLIEQVTDSLGNEHEVEIAQEWIGGVDEFYAELIGTLAIELSGQVDD